MVTIRTHSVVSWTWLNFLFVFPLWHIQINGQQLIWEDMRNFINILGWFLSTYFDTLAKSLCSIKFISAILIFIQCHVKLILCLASHGLNEYARCVVFSCRKEHVRPSFFQYFSNLLIFATHFFIFSSLSCKDNEFEFSTVA